MTALVVPLGIFRASLACRSEFREALKACIGLHRVSQCSHGNAASKASIPAYGDAHGGLA